MKLFIFILTISICCCISLFEYSCINKENSLEQILSKMESLPVDVDIDKYKNIQISDSIPPLSSSDFKIIKYVDSTSCTSCVLQNLYLWNDLIALYKKQYKTINFYFIISNKNYKEKDIITTLRNTGFKNSILLDTAGVFIKTNPNIPKESKCHTFLLDKNNRVILVGDPILNVDIEQLYNRMLDDKFAQKLVNKRLCL